MTPTHDHRHPGRRHAPIRDPATPAQARVVLRRRTGSRLAAALRAALAGMTILGSVSAHAQSLADILKSAPAADWRPIPAENLLIMTLPQGRVLIELAPGFAPNHVANVKALARAHFYDGLFIVRSQDNYVVQWGDADSKKPTGAGSLRLKAEFEHFYAPDEPFKALPDPDTYAPQTGFSGDFPAARDPTTGEAWMTHCYGAVGAGRDADAGSGGGPELYAVTGQAPRQLDRNVTLLGRVIEGMDILSALPRGHGDLGFYQTPKELTPILGVTVAADLPKAQRPAFEGLIPESATFAAVVQNRRFRKDDWYKRPAGRIDVCNLPLLVRPKS